MKIGLRGLEDTPQSHPTPVKTPEGPLQNPQAPKKPHFETTSPEDIRMTVDPSYGPLGS